MSTTSERLPYYWDFCVEYETHLGAFAKAVSGKVTVHDFRDSTPFPGHRIIADLGIDPTQLALPGQSSRNIRATAKEAEANRLAQLRPVLDAAGLGTEAIAELEALLRRSPKVETGARDAVSRRYAPGMERILAQGQLSHAAAPNA